MKKLVVILSLVFGCILVVTSACIKSAYTRKSMDFTFDAAYYWPEEELDINEWKYRKYPAGFMTYLYLPEKYRNNFDSVDSKIPLVVVFHGSDEKWASLHKFGHKFILPEVQARISPEGAAVLVILSRANYFTDPAGTSLMIQNICIKNTCIDRSRILGYGFSQGAKFVVELACHEPRLFKAVMSGSGFYQMRVMELVKVLPVCFYFATAENDSGIFEQGSPTGKLCARWCRNSRYVEYKERRHFFIELHDKTGVKNEDGTDETCIDWISKVIN